VIDKWAIDVIDRYVAQGTPGGFLQGAWECVKAELRVAPAQQATNSESAPSLCASCSNMGCATPGARHMPGTVVSACPEWRA